MALAADFLTFESYRLNYGQCWQDIHDSNAGRRHKRHRVLFGVASALEHNIKRSLENLPNSTRDFFLAADRGMKTIDRGHIGGRERC